MLVTVRTKDQKIGLVTNPHVEPFPQEVIIEIIRFGETGVKVAEINVNDLFQSV